MTPKDCVDMMKNPTPELVPGLQECSEVEALPDGCIKYLRMKVPGMSARDHVWRSAGWNAIQYIETACII